MNHQPINTPCPQPAASCAVTNHKAAIPSKTSHPRVKNPDLGLASFLALALGTMHSTLYAQLSNALTTNNQKKYVISTITF